MKKKICVIGLGYIGLPTATLLVNHGYKVFGVDTNEKIIKKIQQQKINFTEPMLNSSVKSAIKSGRFKVFKKPKPSDIYIICVPTPIKNNTTNPRPDMKYVFQAIRSIIPLVVAGNFIILESTSPVGTISKMQNILKKSIVDINNIHIAYCPERVLPGKIMRELKKNDRVVGGLNLKATKNIANFYRDFVNGEILETDAKTAELCKLAENSFRDVNIAFANELSLICDRQGINPWELIRLTNHHPRVNILQPGIGVGGHCIALDPWFIIYQNKMNSQLIRKSREINNYKTTWVIKKIKWIINNKYYLIRKKIKISCLGLAFKPNVDDLRESPAINIVERLISQGHNVVAVEPNINRHDTIPLVDLKEAFCWADLIIILVKHREFLKLKDLGRSHRSKILDFCGLFEKNSYENFNS